MGTLLSSGAACSEGQVSGRPWGHLEGSWTICGLICRRRCCILYPGSWPEPARTLETTQVQMATVLSHSPLRATSAKDWKAPSHPKPSRSLRSRFGPDHRLLGYTVPPDSYVKVLTPRTSEWACIWRCAFKR